MDFMASQLFVYENKGDSAVIRRCFSRDSSIRIPEKLDGLPVRELMPYAFSAHMEEREWMDAVRRGDARIASGERMRTVEQAPWENADLSSLPVLSGERLERAALPQTLRRVGRYCFYDCSYLQGLEFPGELYDWGSGAFSGCHRVKELSVFVKPDGTSSLKQVLDELPESMNVELCTAESDNTDAEARAAKPESADAKLQATEHEMLRDKKVYARLVFPEFYEEGVENTPARILETHVHGTGILYRNCFQGKKFDFAQYDVLFPYAQAQEDTALLIRLVLGRLRAPYRLEQRARRVYEDYIRENAFLVGTYILDSKDTEGLCWFLEEAAALLPDEEKFALSTQLSDYASRRKDAQAIGRLMDFRKKLLPNAGKRKRLEL
ncbi:MAG: leucine-rich repeat domain-containing protein [Lachnospiraceae bacterium]|nr:leucine-rich repeat domain-containing protein [Lachnospiraceae bacterium]